MEQRKKDGCFKTFYFSTRSIMPGYIQRKRKLMASFDTPGGLRISLASPECIRRWSYGEVTRPDTLDYRTQRPVKDGLFCERIFGPTRDWSCACGKYQREPNPRSICKQCGVEFAPAIVRRERLGHIELAAPVAHPWYVRSRVIGLLLDLSPWQLSAVLAYQRYLVITINEEARAGAPAPQDMGNAIEKRDREYFATLQPGDLLEVADYHRLAALFHHAFQAKTGAEAVRDLLDLLDLSYLAEALRKTIDAQGKGWQRALRRLQIVEAFRASGLHPGWMVLSVIPVLPPELRPLVPLDGGRFASSDLNLLYARVIHQNSRLKRFLEQGAPEIILNHERRLLQDACGALFDNLHTKKRFMDSQRRPLKSLTDQLQGKQGLFRRYLLGKRIDYSGRSVIVVGPEFHLDECGLPKEMACELFKPFVIRRLIDRHYARSPKEAKRMVERRNPLIWNLLAEVMFERVVLLNRAPTLHRLSIQAFSPRLVEGKAIHLHPLVCAGFNADFDGDQMAVHVPLSEAAQEEARRLMLSTRNLRHPATGEPALSPSQEMVLGCFYLSEDRAGPKRPAHAFADVDEARLALAVGLIDVHTKIVARVPDRVIYDAPPPARPRTPERGRIETTVGRLLFNEMLPEPLCYRNYPMTKDSLKALIAECLSICGDEATARLLDEIKQLGYHYATRSGISLALCDMKMPPERTILIEQGRKQAQVADEAYHAGELTYEEWYRQVVAIWTRTTEEISGKLKDVLDPSGTLMTIIKSGATKARFQQIRQLSGICGLMANPAGRIIPFPVISNYVLGLLVWELFIAASGARKGFMDRSLNTSTSGYLTRRLVEAGMEVWITQEDCGTEEGHLIMDKESQGPGLSSMYSRIVGRVLAEDAGKLMAGTLLDERLAEDLLKSGIEQVRVRSPLYCQARYGVCQRCYGSDLATGKLVALGAAVGVVAGQSIGEPGTQLTMRTFHSGGIANNASDITLGLPRVEELFEARVPVQATPFAIQSGIVSKIEKESAGHHRIYIMCREEHGEQVYDIPSGRSLTVREGQAVEAGMPLADGPLNPHEILRLLGQDATQRYLIDEVQRVYGGTGVFIHKKHLEVMVRQMLRYVMVSACGDTNLLPGEIMDRSAYFQHIASILAQGGQPARARPLLLGLTSAVLHTKSWIAAASFQDTSRILAHAAIRCQQDEVAGLKERVVVGKKLPVLS